MSLYDFVKKAGNKVKAIKEDAFRDELKRYGLDTDDVTIEADGDNVKIGGKVQSQEQREKIILALGNVNGVARVNEEITVEVPAPEAVYYTVQGGDSLSKIAKQHYGKASKYMVIFEANKPMLKDPNKIYPGQVLRIPELEEK